MNNVNFTKPQHMARNRKGLIDRSADTGTFRQTEECIITVEAATSDPEGNPSHRNRSAAASTQEEKRSEELDEKIKELFRRAKEGFYDEGSAEDFADILTGLLRQWGDEAIIALSPFIVGNEANAEVVSEALRCLSHLDDSASQTSRLWIISRALQSRSSWIRDSATIALTMIDDPTSGQYLQKAIDRESNEEVIRNMRTALDYLQRSR